MPTPPKPRHLCRRRGPKPSYESNTLTATTRLPQAEYRALEELARDSGQPIAAIIRDAVRMFLASLEESVDSPTNADETE